VPRMSPEDIYAVALKAGFSPEQAVTFTAISLAESGGDPSVNAAGTEDSRGLWQINVSPGVRPNKWGDLYDPLINARAAYEVSGGGRNIQPWSVTHARNAGAGRDYHSYLDEARSAAAAVGNQVGNAGGAPADTGAVDAFVRSALDQVGDSYVFGQEADVGDADPEAFDCSELVQWAAGRAGVELTDGSWNQYLALQGEGGDISVDQAIQTKGALLFYFSEDPASAGGRPRRAHVAISLGDGRIVEAANPDDDVRISDATPGRFNYAAVIPELATAIPTTAAAGSAAPATDATAFANLPEDLPPPTDTEGDGLTDEFEKLLGTDPADLDSDDDTLSDLYETTRSHTDPLAVDTDADGTADALEVAAGTDAGYVRPSDELLAAGFGGAATADTDHDTLSDLVEYRIGSDRDAVDSDSDGVADNLEYALGSDLRSIDSNRDGITDGIEFDAGSLGQGLPPAAPGPPGGDPGFDDGSIPDDVDQPAGDAL
jgi:cell wall-associated NlpC family hydrolase